MGRQSGVSCVVTLGLVVLCGFATAGIAGECLGQTIGEWGWWNPVNAVAVSDGYAYLGVGSDLMVVDVSGPYWNTVSGCWIQYDAVTHITVSGNHAFVSWIDEGEEWPGRGVAVVDISNPFWPGVIGSLGSFWPTEVAILGDYAFVANRPPGGTLFPMMSVHDISALPAAPMIGFMQGPPAENIAVSGTYAYIVALLGGLVVADVSEPTTPQGVLVPGTPGHAYDVAVSGNYAYVTGGSPEGLWVFDVSNPSDPVLVGRHETPTPAWSVAVSGNLAYVTGHEAGLWAIDVSTPSAPVEVGYANVNADRVAVADGYVFVSGDFGLIGFRDCKYLFLDGFESGDCTAWSLEVP